LLTSLVALAALIGTAARARADEPAPARDAGAAGAAARARADAVFDVNISPPPDAVKRARADAEKLFSNLQANQNAPGAGARANATEPSPPRPSGAVLHLASGGFVSGELKDSKGPEILRWQPSAFAAPFDFFTDRVSDIQWPPPAEPREPGGTYCFELAGGDALFGTLVGLDDTAAVVEVPWSGRLHVLRTRILRIDRWRDRAGLIYQGPNGLAGWQEVAAGGGSPGATPPQVVPGPPGVVFARPAAAPPPVGFSAEPGPEKPDAGNWREEAGVIVSDRPGAALRADIGLPARAAVEFEVSWKDKPDFVLALGVGASEKTLHRAFRFEVWDDDLVVHRATEDEADVASVQTIAPGAGRAHLRAYLDQEAGRILVASSTGRPLADLKVGEPGSKALPSVELINQGGEVRLERLRVSRWDGDPPREEQGDRPRVVLSDGSIVYGRVARFDADSSAFVVRDGADESRIAADRVASVFLSSPVDDRPRSIRVALTDGTRLSGELDRVEGGALWMMVPGVKEMTRLPVSRLRSLVVLQPTGAPEVETKPSGTLELEGVRLLGHLVDGRERPGSSCLVWQPAGSATASPLRPGVSGRIVYREKPQPAPTPRRAQPAPAPPGGVLVAVARAFAGNAPQPQPEPAPSAIRRAIHLRSGDVIPSDVTGIDETGVSFRSAFSESTFVPHEKVKVVELGPDVATTVRLSKSKRERLLTLSRVQKDSPPTQLIRSRNGDYLRGRIVSMDEKTLRVEVRLENKDVPRDRVSRIIWLHADETEPPKATSKPPEAPASTRVQALRSDGIRLTFFAERASNGTLSGKSDVLGTCRVRLEAVDQILIGSSIEQAAAQLAYQQWTLKNAPEPKSAQGEGGPADGNDRPGTESALVGKPAPDFRLDLLGGKPFHLADSKGQVVVLDFWATWCGPCLQAMPQVDRVTHEFQDQGVRLIAVNLQETPQQISALLQRQKLDLTVALDRDGVVAEKYGANAIPQTVIIDRNGTVARLFVGGGPHFEDQLREALRSVLSGDKPKEPEPRPANE
jgi:peroxiredoxin